MGSNIEAFFETRFEAILKTPGRLLASILGAFREPRARQAIFVKNGTALQREHDF